MLIINSMYLINLHFCPKLQIFKIHSGKFQKELHIQSKRRQNIKVGQNAPLTYKNFDMSIVDYFSQTQRLACRKGHIRLIFFRMFTNIPSQCQTELSKIAQ